MSVPFQLSCSCCAVVSGGRVRRVLQDIGTLDALYSVAQAADSSTSLLATTAKQIKEEFNPDVMIAIGGGGFL